MNMMSMIHECILYGASRSTFSTHDVLRSSNQRERWVCYIFHSHPPAAVKSSSANWWLEACVLEYRALDVPLGGTGVC